MRSFALSFTALGNTASAAAFASYLDGPQNLLMGTNVLQNILMNTDKSDKYHYPTDFTREIVPKPFHSHNDYWRDIPFYTGLSYGAVSTEADVWLINGTLYVGHEPSALTDARTLSSLYIEPILDTVRRLNPQSRFTQEGEQNGVFDTVSGQTLYFFIDLKTAADETWPAVLEALEPLRTGGWLTTYDGKDRFNRPVTVIGTGNTLLDDVRKYLPRDVFFDAPLSQLSNAEFAALTANEAPIASTNFASSFGNVRKRELDEKQLSLLRQQIGTAHEKGIGARYWNQPAYPIGTRNAMWRILWDEGVDLLNVDDLKGASEFWVGGG